MTIRRILKLLILGPVAIAAILFAVANRGPVNVALNPFSQDPGTASMAVPLYALVIGVLILGVLVGGIAAWLAQHGHRKAERHYRREAERHRAEADRLRVELAAAQPASQPNLPTVLRAS